MRGVTRRELLVGAPAVVLAGCVSEGAAPAPAVKKSASVREVAAVHNFQPSRDGAGVAIRRALGHQKLRDLDPFLLLDEIRSDKPEDYAAGFPQHPHRGFETVSYVLKGAFEHKDSAGNAGTVGEGATQWMTAGRGIVHEEMPKQQPGALLWGFQLWVNLPAAEKMMKPRYQELGAAQIPLVTVDDARVKLIAGEIDGKRGPVDGVSIQPTFLDVALSAGTTLRHELAGEQAVFAYMIEGTARFGGEQRQLTWGQAAVFGPGDTLVATSPSGGRLLVLAGKPIGEPVARRGPFVMNTDAELKQAFADYKAGRLTG